MAGATYRSHVLPPRDSFLLRVDPQIMALLRAWAADELRSVNGQIEFLLRKSLQDAGRLQGSKKADSTQTKSEETPGNNTRECLGD
jgi:hypothetical protein